MQDRDRGSEIRTPIRLRPRRDDNSGQIFVAILIVLVSVVGVMGYNAYLTGRKAPPLSSVPIETEASYYAPPKVGVPVQSSMQQPMPSYAQPVAPSSPTNSQLSRYRSLQEYCNRMARMNSAGEYPALQQAACGDFARFAASIGVSAGRLPDVLMQQQAPRQAQGYSNSSSDTRQPPAECVALEQEKQNINSRTRQAHSAYQAELYRQRLREINARMFDLNCQNH